MTADKAEKFGSLFLAVFAVGLVVQFASVGMIHGAQWIGAAVAVIGALTVYSAVRLWPRPEPVAVRARD